MTAGRIRGGRTVVAAALAAMLTAGPAWGWSNHTVSSYYALEALPEIANAAPVKVENFETFIAAVQPELEKLLAEEEAWARANVDTYPPRPDAIAFKAGQHSGAALREAVLKALRIAPNIKLANLIQPDPRGNAPLKAPVAWKDMNTLSEPAIHSYRFEAVKEGNSLKVLDVVSTAVDEPDYGHDIGLWSDNDTHWAKEFGFMVQPFGNAALDYASQAPFHMGFYHEADILYAAGPFLKNTFPEYRNHLYMALAALAFRTKHDYWGWRFTGWALHYVQDLTQPYHASVLPGVSTVSMLGTNLLSIAGMPGPKDDAIVIVSNRHLAVEKYQLSLVLKAAKENLSSPIVDALRAVGRDAAYPAWDDRTLKDVVSKEAYSAGDVIDQAIRDTMPAQLVSDPTIVFKGDEPGVDLIADVERSPKEARDLFINTVAELSGHLGAHSRNMVRKVLAMAK